MHIKALIVETCVFCASQCLESAGSLPDVQGYLRQWILNPLTTTLVLHWSISSSDYQELRSSLWLNAAMDSINRQRQKRKKLQERDGQSQNQPSQASNVDGSGMLVNQLNSIWDGIDFDQSLQLNGVHQENVHHACMKINAFLLAFSD